MKTNVTQSILMILVALCLSLCGMGLTAKGVSGAVGDVFTSTIHVGSTDVPCTYMITGTDTVQIGDGTNAAIDPSTGGALTIPNFYSDGTTVYTVTAIGAHAFDGCGGITDTGLASNTNILSLGESCFAHCNSLTGTGLASNTTITALPDYCFYRCGDLTSTNLGGNTAITALGDFCFSWCTSLNKTGLAMNSTVTTLGDYCFDSCKSLTDTGLGTNSTLEEISDGCFAQCTHLTDTGLGTNSTVTTIGDDSFFYCTSLISTGLGTNSTVTNLVSDCFSNCSSLTDTGLAANNTITSLAGGGCFIDCTALEYTGLETNSTVTELGGYTFGGCTSLKSTALEINSTVVSVGQSCFTRCNLLTSTGLETNSTVTELGGYCFAECALLATTGLETNSTVATLGSWCFSNCPLLEHAAIGSGVASFGFDMFSNDAALIDVCFFGNTAPVSGYWIEDADVILDPVPDITVYYLSENTAWTGKTVTEAARDGDALKALSRVEVVNGTGNGTPSTYWASSTGFGAGTATEGRYAEGETISLSTTIDPFIRWITDDAIGSFDDNALVTATYTVGKSADQETSTVTAWRSLTPNLNSTDHFKYVIGYADGTVRPAGDITRAEVATIFYRLLVANYRDEIFTDTNDFSDVTSNLWYNKAVSSMAAGEYILGYPDGSFHGDLAITRAEFIAIAVRFLDVDTTNTETLNVSLSDVPTDYWAYDAIATAEHYGWVTGYTDGTFQPEDTITRAEVMTIINRMLDRGVGDSGVMSGFKVWTDNDSSAWYYYEVIEATNDHTYTGSRPNETWTSLTTNYTYDIDKYERP